MNRRYQFEPRDAAFLWAASLLLKKIAASPFTRPAQLATIAKLQHVLSVLPRVTPGVTASVSVCCPRHTFGKVTTYHWYDFGIEDGQLRAVAAGHFHHPISGGDTFTTMTWTAEPEKAAQLDDYRSQLRMVHYLCSYDQGIETINLTADGYTVEILDNDNPFLYPDENEATQEDDDKAHKELATEPQLPLFADQAVFESTRAMLDQLFLDSRLYTQSKDYKDLLDFVVRLPNVAPFNAMLLQLQKPGLKFAASSHDWSKLFGRNPKPKARPLLILWPFAPVALVYDELDTEGRDLPRDVRSFYAEGPITSGRIEVFRSVLARRNIRFEMVDEGDQRAGAIRPLSRPDKPKGPSTYQMFINKNHKPPVQFVTIAHELGHLFLGHLGMDLNLHIPDRIGMMHQQVELEAESVAYLVCARNGVTSASQTYLTHFVRENTTVGDLDVYQVMRAAGQIETLLDLGKRSKFRESKGLR